MRPVQSEERECAPAPVVEASADGARALAATYWREVERTTRRLVRVRARSECTVVRGLGIPLLRFGRTRITVADDRVACSYPIEGGVLARRPGGFITFGQEGRVLTSSISGFHPRLAAFPALYSHVQARVHAAVSRRYFARLVRDADG